MTQQHLWLTVGLTGQLLFTGRFIVQWLCSERLGRSVIPQGFWYLSLSGGLVLLIYAWHRADPVFVLGQSMGVFIYLRNLHLLSRSRRQESQQLAPASEAGCAPATLPLAGDISATTEVSRAA